MQKITGGRESMKKSSCLLLFFRVSTPGFTETSARSVEEQVVQLCSSEQGVRDKQGLSVSLRT